MADLKGRIALVTGASQGIGRACAVELARAGATVVVSAHDPLRSAAVPVRTINLAGGRVQQDSG